jgi:hypothetical protein
VFCWQFFSTLCIAGCMIKFNIFMIDLIPFTKPMKVYDFMTRLNEDSLNFIIDIRPEIYQTSNTTDVRMKLT